MSGAITHWWVQRLSSVALIPMALWLLWAGVSVAGADYSTAVAFVSNPFNAFMVVLMTAVSAFHAQLGIQTIVEDYIPGSVFPKTLIFLTRAGCVLGTLAVAYAVFKLFSGA